jgi:NADPH2:quinone reductase
MKAMVIDTHGDPTVFQQREVPTPALQPGHVLIRVHATSVNPVDCLLRSTALPFAPALPAILHGDVAGVVERVAPDVQGLRVGDEVYGCAGGVQGCGGALAEFMLVDANLVALKPRSLSMREAAALPLVTITAWQGVHQRLQLRPATRILIHGGAGGVGHVAVQLARAAGAEVHTTVSGPDKATLARRMGAHEVIHYRDEKTEDYVQRLTGGQGYDAIFDTVGGANLGNAFAGAALNGHVVTTISLGEFDLTLAHLKGLSLHVIFMLIPLIHGIGRAGHGHILRDAARLVDAGQLRPVLDPHDLRIPQVAEAHALWESGAAQGKIVLTW